MKHIHEVSQCSVEHCSHLCMTAAYFDISLLHIIYPILIGRGRSERGREGRRRFEKLCHAAMFAQTEKCGALCGRRTGRQNVGVVAGEVRGVIMSNLE